MYRALRRHHKFRILQKARKIVDIWNIHSSVDKEWIAHRIQNNLQPCSCPMCGNPRRFWNEKTIQELRQEQRFREYI